MVEEAKKEDTELELDIKFDGVINFVKKNRTAVIYCLLLVLLLMTFYSRTQNIPALEGKYLISPDDPYIFLRYADDIANNKLPSNDTLRYYPEGVDITTENLGSAYVAGYALKFVRIFNPSATMYDIAAYFAPVLLVIGIAAFFFLTREILEDNLAALVASGFLAFSLAILFRTTAGFLEKEPLFLPLMILGFLFFLRAYKQKNQDKWLYINGALGGIFTGLAGYASGLFFFIGIYLSVFIIIEVFLQKINKQKLITFGLWFAFMSIILLSVFTKYGNPITYFMDMRALIPIVALLFGIISVYIKKPKQLDWLPYGLFHILVGICLVLLIGGIISVFKPGFLIDNLGFVVERINIPIGVSRFAQSVSENQPPAFIESGNSWWSTFGVAFMSPGGGFISVGIIFILFFLGGIIMFYKEFKNFDYVKYLTIIFTIFMCALIFEQFSNDQRYQWVNSLFSNQFIYFALFGIAIIAFMFLVHRKHEHLEKINSSYLLILTWFIIATIAANGAVRLFFMLAFPAMIMASYFLKWATESISKINVNYKFVPYLVGAVLIILMFAVASISNANMYPGLETYYDALNWVKDNTPTNSVFTHWWDYGYIVQTVAQRATVVDPGNFFVERDYDTGGYLFNAHNNSEALAYLNKYGKPNYWFVISEDVPKFYQISRLGSLSNLTGALSENQTLGRESYFSTYALSSQTNIKPNNLGIYTEYPTIIVMDALSGTSQVMKDFRSNNVLYSGDKTFILRYIIPATQNTTGPILVQLFNSVTQKSEVFKAQCVCIKKVGCSDINNTDNVPMAPVCVLPFDGGVLNIPYKTKDVLFTQLYVLGKTIPGYNLVYTAGSKLDLYTINGRGTNVQIYKFNYSEIENNVGW